MIGGLLLRLDRITGLPIQFGLELHDLLDRLVGYAADGHLASVHHKGGRLVDVQAFAPA